MSQPSYKNLLKRSRSSIDPVTGRDDFIQGIALACKARLHGNSVLQSGRAIQQVSSVSQIVAEDSLAINFLDHSYLSSDNIEAVTLARSPSFPFDSNKSLGRWLLAGQEEDRKHKQQAPANRRRKHVVDHATDHAGQASCFSSMNSSVKDRNARKPIVLQVPAECTSSRTVSEMGSPSVFISDSVETVISPSEKDKETLGPEKNIFSSSLSDRAEPRTNSGMDTAYLTSRQASCVSRDRCPQFGLLSVCGRRREMEDTCTVEPYLFLLPCDAMGRCSCTDRAFSSFHFFGIYDGHGGTQASSFCKTRLHKALTEELIKDVRSFKKDVSGVVSDWTRRWRKIMESCFLKIDKEVGGVCPTGECGDVPNCCINPVAPDNVGSTAVVVVIGPCQIIVGNCGDSRAVLSRGGNVVALSQDHKPDREEETNRIVAAGGKIIYWDGYRVGGLLAMSRAIGDRFLKQYVIALPEVTCIERTKEDECLILASDGLWDVISNEMACDVARRRLKSQRRKCAKSSNPGAEDTPARAAAALLTQLALSRGSKDNVSVIVIDLKSYYKKSV